MEIKAYNCKSSKVIGTEFFSLGERLQTLNPDENQQQQHVYAISNPYIV